LFTLGICAGKRCIDCHHRTPKDRKDCAGADNAVNQLGPAFYPLINVTAPTVMQTLRPFDNAV